MLSHNTHTHTHVRTHTNTHNTHTQHSDTHTHTHTHVHTHTHTHTHTQMTVYRWVVEDVVKNVKDEFLNESVDLQVLDELKQVLS